MATDYNDVNNRHRVRKSEQVLDTQWNPTSGHQQSLTMGVIVVLQVLRDKMHFNDESNCTHSLSRRQLSKMSQLSDIRDGGLFLLWGFRNASLQRYWAKLYNESPEAP